MFQRHAARIRFCCVVLWVWHPTCVIGSFENATVEMTGCQFEVHNHSLEDSKMRMVFPTHTSRFMDGLATDVGTLVESLFSEVAECGEERTHSMALPMDIDESDDAYLVTLDVPGVSLEAIEIEMHEDTLSISGSRMAEGTEATAETKDAEDVAPSDDQGVEAAASRLTARRRERLFGKFARRVRLPHPVEQDDVSASLNDGVLVITLPKADPNKGKRRIPVSRG